MARGIEGEKMGILDSLSNILGGLSGGVQSDRLTSGAIDYGKQKKDGSHDHRYNKGKDRTQAQKEGDKKKGKESEE